MYIKDYAYRKPKLKRLCVIFSRFSLLCFLNLFMNIKCQWDLKMGKTCARVSGFRDLVAADGEPVRSETVVSVFNSIRSRGHCIKESHNLTKQVIIEIVYTTKLPIL